MFLKNLIDEDFVNYKYPSMFIGTALCKGFKCDKECGRRVCQNSPLAATPEIFIDNDELIQRFCHNPITDAVVIGGLEPFDTDLDTYNFIMRFRTEYSLTNKIVIYTGYYPSEIALQLKVLKDVLKTTNIIIKFGRFIPDKESHYDDVLGVNLASPNQFAIELDDYTIDELVELEKKYKYMGEEINENK